MHEYLISELRRLGRPDLDEARIFSELRDIICRHAGVKPAQVVPNASFVTDLRLD
jgi:acyl carrier protein